MVTASLNTGRLVNRHAHYPVVLIALIKYLPENRPDHICSRAVPDLPEPPGLWQVAWFPERRKILLERTHSLAPLTIWTALALNPSSIRFGGVETGLWLTVCMY